MCTRGPVYTVVYCNIGAGARTRRLASVVFRTAAAAQVMFGHYERTLAHVQMAVARAKVSDYFCAWSFVCDVCECPCNAYSACGAFFSKEPLMPCTYVHTCTRAMHPPRMCACAVLLHISCCLVVVRADLIPRCPISFPLLLVCTSVCMCLRLCVCVYMGVVRTGLITRCALTDTT